MPTSRPHLADHLAHLAENLRRSCLAHRWLIAFVLAPLLGAPALFAQAEKPPLAKITGAKFGLGDVIIAERFMPITVQIAGGDIPVNGEATVTYLQDATQRTAIVRPFATTPGKTIEVSFVAALPLNTSNVNVAIRGDGFPDDSVRYDSRLTGTTPDDVALPDCVSRDTVVVGVVDDDSLVPLVPKSLNTRLLQVSDDKKNTQASFDPGHVRVWGVAPQKLPLAPASFDALNTLVIRDQIIPRLEPRQIDAIRVWLQRGGSLVVIANQPGTSLARLLPDGAEPFSLDEVQSASEPASAALRPLSTANRPISLATSISHRPIRLTPTGQRDGWMPVLPIDRAGRVAGASAGSLGVIGPMGFGQLLVLGFDPSRVAEPISGDATADVWDALLTEHARLINPAPWNDDSDYSLGSGRSRSAGYGLQMAIASLCTPRPPSLTVIVVIIVGGVLLAALIGPIDLVVLGFLKARQYAWITATGWLLLASVAAWLLPEILRPLPGSANRVEVIDVLAQPESSASMTAAVTTIFAGKAGAVPEAFGRAASFRGISSTGTSSGGDQFAMPELRIAQDSAGNAAALRFDLRRATLRSFIEDSPSADAPGFTLEGTPANPRIVLARFPKGARIRGAQLVTTNTIKTLRPTPDGGALAAGGQPADRSGINASLRHIISAFGRQNMIGEENLRGFGGAVAPSEVDARTPGLRVNVKPSILTIPGADVRTDALARRDASGRFAILLLEVDQLPPLIKLDATQQTTRRAFYRVAIPLPDSFRSGPPVAPLPAGPSPESPS